MEELVWQIFHVKNAILRKVKSIIYVENALKIGISNQELREDPVLN